MPIIHRRPSWQLPGLRETPPDVLEQWTKVNRRGLLRSLVAGGAAAALGLSGEAAHAAAALFQDKKKADSGSPFFPAERNAEFRVDERPLTDELAASRFNNFYEFSTGKRVASLVKDWDISGWKLDVAGLVNEPTTFDMDELGKAFAYEERLYRFRCVETWAMTVPWTGFPLKKLMDRVKPQAGAKFVKFVSFDHKKAKGTRRATASEPWPYVEALTIEEASNDLAMIVTGIYGHPLPKQHGAPVRLIVPWKYGFKSGKSLARIEFVSSRPATFWPTIIPAEYDFLANVNPAKPHPRWSQATEWDVGTKARRQTLPFNGYGDLVASLYAG
jgi:sulfoxide reductase catalytic subunit YedY